MYTDIDVDQVSPFQIARILPEDEADDTARIMVLDPLEFRIVIFEADTGLAMSAGSDAVAERAKELLETEGGFIVHAIEPDGEGLAVVAEINSDPVQGWVSWVNGNDVLLAFLHPMAEEEGWARIRLAPQLPALAVTPRIGAG